MDRRYSALRAISFLFKIMSVIVIILGSFLPLAEFLGITVLSSFWLNLGTIPIIIMALIAALFLWAGADLLMCIVDIELNTRGLVNPITEKPKRAASIKETIKQEENGKPTAKKPVQSVLNKKLI